MLTLTSPVETPLHRVPAGWKLGALALATTALFALRDPVPLAAVCLGVAALHLSQGRAFAGHAARLLRPLWPFALVVGAWHGWTGDPSGGAAVILRLVAAVALANLVTMTTRLSDMLAVLERLAQPLSRLGLAPRALALAVALVVRFTPVLLDKAQALRQAWQARCPRRAGWRVVLPLTLLALDDADRVADALRARGGL